MVDNQPRRLETIERPFTLQLQVALGLAVIINHDFGFRPTMTDGRTKVFFAAPATERIARAKIASEEPRRRIAFPDKYGCVPIDMVPRDKDRRMVFIGESYQVTLVTLEPTPTFEIKSQKPISVSNIGRNDDMIAHLTTTSQTS